MKMWMHFNVMPSIIAGYILLYTADTMCINCMPTSVELLDLGFIEASTTPQKINKAIELFV